MIDLDRSLLLIYIRCLEDYLGIASTLSWDSKDTELEEAHEKLLQSVDAKLASIHQRIEDLLHLRHRQ